MISDELKGKIIVTGTRANHRKNRSSLGHQDAVKLIEEVKATPKKSVTFQDENQAIIPLKSDLKHRKAVKEVTSENWKSANELQK